jgi:hypothetical protein
MARTCFSVPACIPFAALLSSGWIRWRSDPEGPSQVVTLLLDVNVRYRYVETDSVMCHSTPALFLVGGLLGGALALPLPCTAQTSPPAPTVQQSQAAQPLQVGALPVLPAAGGASQASSGAVSTSTSGAATATSSSSGKRFSSVGQSLPGMPGGPPIRGVAGAQDPSGAYMRPPVIGPLFCDPAVNIPC